MGSPLGPTSRVVSLKSGKELEGQREDEGSETDYGVVGSQRES